MHNVIHTCMSYTVKPVMFGGGAKFQFQAQNYKNSQSCQRRTTSKCDVFGSQN